MTYSVFFIRAHTVDHKAETRQGSPTNVLHARKSYDKLSMNMRGAAMSYNQRYRVRLILHPAPYSGFANEYTGAN